MTPFESVTTSGNPTVFGLAHILYLVITTAMMVASLILIKKYCKTKRSQNIAVIIAASLLLVSIIMNRITVSLYSGNWISLVPTSFCGMTSLLFSVAALIFFRRWNHSIFHFFIYLAFLGGVIANFYPDYIGQASTIWHGRTITGLLHHTFATYLAVLLVVLGLFKPELRRWYCLPLGFTVYMTLGLFMVSVLPISDAMHINNPIVPVLEWYIIGPLFVALQVTSLAIYERIKQVRNKKKETSQPI
ncbi:MAG: YwaF family protein [Firmicutes bacterium]|nr:YwaF family protein [Bacillota bacterium]